MNERPISGRSFAIDNPRLFLLDEELIRGIFNEQDA